ncbi:hypothetical protein TRFO_18356 [Tritrichomonas foetus]|uniref:F5/8 type C domain-containing protein n=1 Tax=Tritrichomonas foetus TaxID=1144522 RepID=A0A1J4KL05_9EUKA|nr:hypothetical protein TRFO_18356 [Tritrichomonas foetus]|eukprot:OHT11975.1 hypothetical protein TRFO_18356 [Tritrichomonas foetus]
MKKLVLKSNQSSNQAIKNIYFDHVKSQIDQIDLTFYENDFTIFFIFQNATNSRKSTNTLTFEIKMPRLIADLLSPIVRKLHQTDKTIDLLSINLDVLFLKSLDLLSFTQFNLKSNITYRLTNPRTFIHDIFNFLNKDSIDKLNINEQEYINFTYLILFFLGNEDLFEKIKCDLAEEITIGNVVNQILYKSQYYYLKHNTCEFHYYHPEKDNHSREIPVHLFHKEIDFLASHFYEIDMMTEMEKLPTYLLESVLYNEKLCVNDESQLYQCVKKIVEKTKNYSLYSVLSFPYMTGEDMNDFLHNIKYDDLSAPLWSNLVQYISNYHSHIYQDVAKCVFNKKNTKLEKYHSKIIHLPFADSSRNKMNGIISFLTLIYSKNIIDTNIVTLTASSSRIINDKEYSLSYLVDFNKTNRYCTKNLEKSWIRFDFKDCKIMLTHYSLISSNSNQPKNWSIEISNDGQSWETIDIRENDSSCKGSYALASFQLNQNKPEKFARYVRIIQNGLNWDQNNYLQLCSVEFYGKFLVM